MFRELYHSYPLNVDHNSAKKLAASLKCKAKERFEQLCLLLVVAIISVFVVVIAIIRTILVVKSVVRIVIAVPSIDEIVVITAPIRTKSSAVILHSWFIVSATTSSSQVHTVTIIWRTRSRPRSRLGIRSGSRVSRIFSSHRRTWTTMRSGMPGGGENKSLEHVLQKEVTLKLT